jgi:hypothetical protein
MRDLNAYRARLDARMERRTDWRPPEFTQMRERTVILSFDQTLSHTGWVTIVVRNGRISVMAKGTISTTAGDAGSGFPAMFERANQLDDRLRELDLDAIGGSPPDEVVHEMPAVGGYNTESSLLAAREIIRYARDIPGVWNRPKITMISIQHSRFVLAGSDARNDKKAGHRALAEFIPGSAERTWNEHTRDAAINALARLCDLKEEA